jgi:hypothetical protein
MPHSSSACVLCLRVQRTCGVERAFEACAHRSQHEAATRRCLQRQGSPKLLAAMNYFSAVRSRLSLTRIPTHLKEGFPPSVPPEDVHFEQSTRLVLLRMHTI